MITTLLEVKRLVRNINALLEPAADLSQAGKIAQDYTEVYKAASLRLTQVESMYTAGNTAQALQLAEQAPALPDLLALLEFPKCEEWRHLCKSQSMPCPERFNEKAVESVNVLYEAGISLDHPFYARYREAMSRRDDAGAYTILQAIVKLNPSDTDAADQLRRLSVKVLTALLSALDSSLRAGDSGKAMEQLTKIESTSFNPDPSGPVWLRAQSLRRDFWVRAAEGAREKDLFGDVFEWLERIRELETNHSLPPGSDTSHRMEELERWAQERRHQHEQDSEFRAHKRDLLIKLAASEEKDTAARNIATGELRKDYEDLNRIWRALVDFGRSLPDELTSRFKKRIGILELLLQRRQKQKIALISAVTVLALGMTTLATIWVVGLMNAKDLAQRFSKLMSDREVRQVEQLLATTRKENPQGTVRSDVQEAMGKSEKFLTEELAKLKTFNTLLQELPTELQPSTPPAQIGEWAEKNNAVKLAHQALAPDLAKETANALEASVKRWNNFLEEENGRRHQEMEKLLKTYEDALAGWDFDKPVEEIKTLVAAAKSPRDTIHAWIKETGEVLKNRPDSLTRFQTLVQRQKRYETETEKVFSERSGLHFAKTMADYQKAVEALSDSEFARDPSVAAARKIRGKTLSGQALTQVALCGKNINLWNLIKDLQMPSLMPSKVMPKEKQLLVSLKNNEAVAATYHRYLLNYSGTAPNSFLCTEQIPERPLESEWKKFTGIFIDNGIQSFPSSKTVEFGFFNNTWKRADNKPFRLEYKGEAIEPKFFYQLELHKGIGEPGEPPRLPLIKMLDDIQKDNSTSPLFRAWLFLQIVGIMEIQPEGWGLEFAPLVQKHKQDLIANGADKIKPGDWYLDKFEKELGPSLKNVLSAPKASPYTTQAKSLANLFHETVKAGFEFVGHVKLDGSPQVHSEVQVNEELWGWDSSGKPAKFYQKFNLTWSPTKELPIPFSPLYSLKESKITLLRNANVIKEDPLLYNKLPALF